MNAHAIRSPLAIAEAAIMMPDWRGINTAQRNGPVSGCEHDTLVAVWLMTIDDNTTGWDLVMDCILNAKLEGNVESWLRRSKVHYPECVIEKGSSVRPNFAKAVPGRMLLSILFPDDFNFEKNIGNTLTKKYPSRPKVKIENGIILPDSGPINKDMIGPKRNGIVHYLWVEYSPETCSDFLASIRRLTYTWITHTGYSIGLSDCVVSDATPVAQLITAIDIECADIMRSYSGAEREVKLNAALGNAIPQVETVVDKALNKGMYNSLTVAREAGAKGSSINSAQIAGLLGQQSIGGRRPPKMLSNRSRRLPYFEEGDDSPAAGGFVYNSFLKGLTPSEVFFHAQTGRVGVVDTSVRTAETGYGFKRMSKKLEDYVVRGDGSVRDSEGCIVQFLYGDDGMDAINLQECSGGAFPLPFDVRREAKRFDVGDGERIALTEDQMELVLSQFRVGAIACELTEIHSYILKEEVRKHLSEVKLPATQIPLFCRRLFDRFEKAKCEYGTSVGLIAACSLGEPATQQTLSNFHTSGIAAKDVTMGLPKLNELLNATKNPSKPVVQVAFKHELAPDVHVLELNKRRKAIEGLFVSRFVKNVKLMYIPKDVPGGSPSPFATTFKYETPEWYKLATSMLDPPKIKSNHWVVRMTMALDKMYEMDITLVDIQHAIEREIGDHVSVMRSPLIIAEIEVYIDVGYLMTYARGKLAGNDYHLTDENMAFFLTRDVVVKALLSTHVRGLKTVIKTSARIDNGRDNPFSRGDEKSEWVIDASVNKDKNKSCPNSLLEVLNEAMTNTTCDVDPTRTWSTDLWDTLEVLGIEAVRMLLYSEFHKILAFDGTYVNPRHLQLLVDSMTRGGGLTSVRRDGIREETGVLAQGLFEKAIDNFASAAMFSKVDELAGVSGCVMFGSMIHAGTGSVTVRKSDEPV